MNSDKEPDLVQSILDAILQPHLVYKTGFSVRRATHFSIIAGLFMIASFQTFVADGGLVAFIVLVALAGVFLFLELADLSRAFFFMMTAESDRRMANNVFANSLLTERSDTTLNDFRTYNIRVFETSSIERRELSLLAIIVSLILIALDLWIVPSAEPIRYDVPFLVPIAVVGTLRVTWILFWALVIFFTGIIGIILSWYSRNRIERWTKWTDNEVYLEAEKVASKHPIEVMKTFEEAMALLLSARTGDLEAQEEVARATLESGKQDAQAARIMQILRVTIVVVMIIDALVFLLL
jgi:hypothetical protein